MTTLTKENFKGTCRSCIFWVRRHDIRLDIGMCCDPRSTHFQHLIVHTHPACDHFDRDTAERDGSGYPKRPPKPLI